MTTAVIDWERLDQLAQGTPVTMSKDTCSLAEILVKEAGAKENATMELAVQVALWREAYTALRGEYKIPEDPNARRALGFSDGLKLVEENNLLRVQLAKARYALVSTAGQLQKAADQLA